MSDDEETLESLADRAPDRLLDELREGTSSAVRMTFVAEAAGLIHGRPDDVIDALAGALRHSKSYVREGAVYALARLNTSRAKDLLRSIAETDPDEDVRGAARENLDD